MAAGRLCIGQTHGHGLAATQGLTGQAQIFATSPSQTAEKETPAHIGKQANVGFGHGHLGALGDQAQSRSLGQAHAAAHDDAIHESDVRLGVGVDQVVEGVFLGEKVFQGRVTGQSRLVKKTNISAGAEMTEHALFVAAADGHRQHLGVVTPSQQASRQLAHHGQGQGVQGPRPIQGDQAHPRFDFTHHIRHLPLLVFFR